MMLKAVFVTIFLLLAFSTDLNMDQYMSSTENVHIVVVPRAAASYLTV